MLKLLASITVICLAIITLVFASMTPPAVGGDPQRGLLAAQQFDAGISPSIATMVTRDPGDLDRRVATPITFWPPLYQAVPHVMTSRGTALGTALRIILLACWSFGLVGWHLYFRAVLESTTLALAVTALQMCLRSTHEQFFVFTGGDPYVWALTPWIILAALRSASAESSSRQLMLAALAGFAVAILPWFKYSAALIAIGIAVGMLWNWKARLIPIKPVLSFAAGASLGLLVDYGTGLFEFILSKNPSTAGSWDNSVRDVLLTALGSLSIAWTNCDYSLTHLQNWLQFPSDWLSPSHAGCLLLFPLAFLLVSHSAGIHRSRFVSGPNGTALRLAVSIAAVVVAGVAVIQLRGGEVSYEGRHYYTPALALLPFLVLLILRSCLHTAVSVKTAGMFTVAVFIALPAGHGMLSFAEKSLIRSQRQRGAVTDSGVRCVELAGSESASRAIQHVRQTCSTRDVLVVWGADLAREFADYPLVVLPTTSTAVSKFNVQVGSRVNLLIPAHIFSNAVLMSDLQALFPVQCTWTEAAVTGSIVVRLYGVTNGPPSAFPGADAPIQGAGEL